MDAGGARETVVDGVTGVLVGDATVDGFAAGLRRALRTPFDPADARANALRFSRERFKEAFSQAVADAIDEKRDRSDAAGWPPPWQPADRSDAARRPQPPQQADGSDAARWPPPSQQADRETNQ